MEFYLRVNYTCGESGEQRACYYFVSTPNDRSFYSKVKLSLGDPLDQQSSSNVQFYTVDKCEHSNGRRRMKKL
ncbi:unnamed protein product, partial [Mesorhabditis belari]|uniref:Uncharacterized protein n=1 Tax=Mesorhabditis belari TaxID=2138241 RepID=A0AAF3F8Q6_9BILA